MRNLIEDILATGLGVLVVTREKAEEMVESMIKQGDITRKQGKEVLRQFLQKSEEKTTGLYEKITENVKKRLSEAGFVNQKELEELQLQINELKEEVHSLKMELKEKGDES